MKLISGLIVFILMIVSANCQTNLFTNGTNHSSFNHQFGSGKSTHHFWQTKSAPANPNNIFAHSGKSHNSPSGNSKVSSAKKINGMHYKLRTAKMNNLRTRHTYQRIKPMQRTAGLRHTNYSALVPH